MSHLYNYDGRFHRSWNVLLYSILKAISKLFFTNEFLHSYVMKHMHIPTPLVSLLIIFIIKGPLRDDIEGPSVLFSLVPSHNGACSTFSIWITLKILWEYFQVRFKILRLFGFCYNVPISFCRIPVPTYCFSEWLVGHRLHFPSLTPHNSYPTRCFRQQFQGLELGLVSACVQMEQWESTMAHPILQPCLTLQCGQAQMLKNNLPHILIFFQKCLKI